MGDHDNGLVKIFAGGLEQADHLLACAAVQISRGLVGQDDGGLRGQRPRDGRTLLLPPGQLAGLSGQLILQPQGTDDLHHIHFIRFPAVQLHRKDAKLPDGAFFLEDIIGLDVVDGDGRRLGVLREVLSPSLQQVYVVEGEREIMIPAVPEFILETNIEGGFIKVRLIEGM